MMPDAPNALFALDLRLSEACLILCFFLLLIYFPAVPGKKKRWFLISYKLEKEQKEESTLKKKKREDKTPKQKVLRGRGGKAVIQSDTTGTALRERKKKAKRNNA